MIVDNPKIVDLHIVLVLLFDLIHDFDPLIFHLFSKVFVIHLKTKPNEQNCGFRNSRPK
jgi:hypothetical protein